MLATTQQAVASDVRQLVDSTAYLAMLDFSEMGRPANFAPKAKETLKITQRLSVLRIAMPPALFKYTIPSSCGVCNSAPIGAANTCITCAPGHYLSDKLQGTCTPCANSTGRGIQTAISTINETPEACTVTCHPSCKTCSSSLATGCLDCATDYEKNTATGACTRTPCGAIHSFKNLINIEGVNSGAGQFRVTDDAACQSCGAGCSQCLSSTKCAVCLASFTNSEGVCRFGSLFRNDNDSNIR